MRQRIDLGGQWDFVTEGGAVEKRTVPSSHHWMGQYTYRREFEARAAEGRRILLCFDGLATEGTLYVNGTELGELEPYVEYRYDITALLMSGNNRVELRMTDVGARFAAYNGWSHYAGICRPVYLLEVPECYIEDVYFHYTFSDNYQNAACTTEISLAGGVPADLSLRAEWADGEGASETVRADQTMLCFNVPNPALWSPETPELYHLTVYLERDGQVLDDIRLPIGFKEFIIRGNHFLLNGEPVFLFGVCRHDLQSDADGFTQSDGQIERDMRMIKESGANYVRLVHYPHDKRVLDWADRLGLLVSGEPGFWWSNLTDGDMVERGREVMRRLVLRDRSRVSVAFWLTFNECVLYPEFIQSMVETVRSVDAVRPVSGANCMDMYSTKPLFDDNGFDFYTYHPYGPDPGVVTGGVSEGNKWTEGWKSLADVAAYLCSKPLVFTEWGGYYVHGNPTLFRRFCEELQEMSLTGKLAGAAYWVWADYYELNRPGTSNVDGVTVEGLVRMDRSPRENLAIFSQAAERREKPEHPGTVGAFALGEIGHIYRPVSLDDLRGTPEQETAWEAALERVKDTAERRRGRIHVLHSPGVHVDKGPVLPRAIDALGALNVRLPAGRPLLVNERSGPLSLSLNEPAAAALYMIGQASFVYGYPADGAYGELLGEYHMLYADGTTEVLPLCNGNEVATAHRIYINTLLDPVAHSAEKAFDITFDPRFERYRIHALRIPLRADAVLTGISVVSRHPLATLLLYGISVEE